MEIIRAGKTRYNQILQGIQEEVLALGLEARIQTDHGDGGEITRATYEVYWDGSWHKVASEVPFVGEANDGTIFEDLWMKINCHAVRELATS